MPWPKGKPREPEDKKKKSKALKGRALEWEHRQNISKARKKQEEEKKKEKS